jgi:hypothetical protein
MEIILALLLIRILSNGRWVRSNPPKFPIVNTAYLGMNHEQCRDNVGQFVNEMRDRHYKAKWYRWEV